MNGTVLLIATILIWIAVAVGTYQRIFEMPKRFANHPASFELIRRQSKTARSFWIPLSILFVVFACAALILNCTYAGTRLHIIGALVSFGLNGLVSVVYFVKAIIAFT